MSHGYVVVTLDQPGTAAASVWSDGRVLPVIADKLAFNRYMPLALSQASDQVPKMNGVALRDGIIPFLARDLSFVLDQLKVANMTDPVLASTMDMEHVGAFGMSLGGYIAPEVCHQDSRFKACLAVDAGKSITVALDGLDQPLMLISRDAEVMREERSKAGGWPEPEIEHTYASQRELFEHNRGDTYFVTMNGMYHVNWTDAPIWSPLIQWMGLAGPIDAYMGFAMTSSCTLSFFDRYLKGAIDVRICGEIEEGPTFRLETRLAGSSGHS